MKFVAPARVEGRVTPPASKSVAIRAIAAACLAESPTTLSGNLEARDIRAALGVVRALGSRVEERQGAIVIVPKPLPDHAVVQCGESALCLRAFSAILSLGGGRYELHAEGTLLNRSTALIKEGLAPLGVQVTSANDCPPVHLCGRLASGTYTLDGSVSSQLISGLMIALPLQHGDSLLNIQQMTSAPYLRLTQNIMQVFGVRTQFDAVHGRVAIPGGQRYQGGVFPVEGDWSAAAALVVAGAMSGRVVIQGVEQGSDQADRTILSLVKDAGAGVRLGHDGIEIRAGRLRGIDADLKDTPDLLPVLSVLAVAADGVTTLRGVGRLRHKESDRPAIMVRELTALGARVALSEDTMRIEGGRLQGGPCSAHGDHRIAMAMALAGLISESGVSIEDDSCVAKSYPSFFRDLEAISVPREDGQR